MDCLGPTWNLVHSWLKSIWRRRRKTVSLFTSAKRRKTLLKSVLIISMRMDLIQKSNITHNVHMLFLSKRKWTLFHVWDGTIQATPDYLFFIFSIKKKHHYNLTWISRRTKKSFVNIQTFVLWYKYTDGNTNERILLKRIGKCMNWLYIYYCIYNLKEK